MSLIAYSSRRPTADRGGSGCGNWFCIGKLKRAKKQNPVNETGVLRFGGLGVVSEAAGVRLFVDLTVGRQFSAHSKPEVT